MLFLKFLVEEILRCFAEVGQISVYIFYVLCALSPQDLIRNGNTVTFIIWKDSSYVCQEFEYIFNQYFPIAQCKYHWSCRSQSVKSRRFQK